MIYLEEAEAVVLGSLFGPGRSREHIGRCLEVLEPEDFTGDRRIVFCAVREAFSRGSDPSLVLNVRECLSEALEPLLLADLMETAGTSREARAHIPVLKRQRRLREWSSLVSTPPSTDQELESLVNQAYLLTQHTETQPMRDLGDIVNDYVNLLTDKPEALAPMKTGIEPFDQEVGGIYPGRVYVVGARTNYGKTALMTGMTLGVARNGGKGLILSLEMDVQEMAERVLTLATDVPGGKLRSPKGLSQQDWNRLIGGQAELSNSGVKIAECFSNTTLAHIMGRIRFAAAMLGGLDIVVVDYVQLLSLGRQSETRNLELSEISRALKLLAKEMKVAMVVGSQLRRGAEHDKRGPTVDDLRDSGSLGQDANMVILLDRPEERKKDKDNLRLSNTVATDILIAKNRNGRTGSISTTFIPSSGRFEG